MTGPKNGGRSALGYRGGVAGSIRQQVHDGDTINVRAVGNFGVRFLGVDAPEISFALPGEKAFKGLADPEWQAYLANPFTTPFNPPLSLGLLGYLKTKVGPGVATKVRPIHLCQDLWTGTKHTDSRPFSPGQTTAPIGQGRTDADTVALCLARPWAAGRGKSLELTAQIRPLETG